MPSRLSAESAIQTVVPSIPHVALVVVNIMLAQELAIFFLKRAAAVMFLLGFHVFYHGVQLTRADRKSSIAALPIKFPSSGASSLIHLDDFFFRLSTSSACERVLGSVTMRWT
jgi:hypothetical protein